MKLVFGEERRSTITTAGFGRCGNDGSPEIFFDFVFRLGTIIVQLFVSIIVAGLILTFRRIFIFLKKLGLGDDVIFVFIIEFADLINRVLLTLSIKESAVFVLSESAAVFKTRILIRILTIDRRSRRKRI